MIETKYLAGVLQDGLNSYNTKKFNIFADEGDLIQALRCRMEYTTNGIIEETSNTIIPIKNIVFQTISLNLNLLVDLDITGKRQENGNEQSSNLIDVKSVIYQFIEDNNGKTQTINLNDREYNVTTYFGNFVDGAREAFGDVSNGIWLQLNCNFAIFENGVNASECEFIIDGENVLYTRAVITKQRTADNTPVATEKGTKTMVLTGGKSFDLTIPATNTPLGTAIMQDLLGNEDNIAHCLRVTTPIGNANYICVFGNESASFDSSMSVGFNISLTECMQNLAKYGENWEIYTTLNNLYEITSNNENLTIFWGDGKTNYIEADGIQTITHTYTKEGKKTIRVFKG